MRASILVRRIIPRFTLRSLVIFLCLLCVLFGYVGVHLRRQQLRGDQIEDVLRNGGEVAFHYNWSYGNRGDGAEASAKPPGPLWLRRLLGNHAFSDVAALTIPSTSKVDLRQLARTCPSIVALVIHEREMSVEEWHSISMLAHLRQLTVHGIRLGEGVPYIARITTLEAMGAESSGVNDRDVRDLVKLRNLRVLNLRNTRITDVGIQHLCGLASLTDLDLAYTRVSDSGIEKLAQLRHLSYLDVEGCSVSRESLEELKARNRNLVILLGSDVIE